MVGDKQGLKEALGLISLAVVPFGVFVYLYSTQILSDMSYLPDGVVQGLLAQSQTKLGLIRLTGAVTTLIGAVFLLVYVADYLKNPKEYMDDYRKSLAIFGCVVGFVWIVAFTLWGYLPAASTLGEYSVLAQQGASSGNQAAQDLLIGSATDYEITVFNKAATGSAVALGVVWWLISLVSLKAPPGKTASVRSDMTGNRWYCGECGSELPVDDVSRIEKCPFCSERV